MKRRKKLSSGAYARMILLTYGFVEAPPIRFRAGDFGGVKMFEGGEESDALLRAIVEAVRRLDAKFVLDFSIYMRRWTR